MHLHLSPYRKQQERPSETFILQFRMHMKILKLLLNIHCCEKQAHVSVKVSSPRAGGIPSSPPINMKHNETEERESALGLLLRFSCILYTQQYRATLKL